MKKTDQIYLSVVIPAYNESKRIGATLRDVDRYLRAQDYSYEIIVVNDGSKDDTARVVHEFERTIPHLMLIDNKKNMGKGYAVKSGMMFARGKYRLFMDADNSTKIDELDTFISEMEVRELDVAIGSIAFSFSDTKERAGAHRRIFSDISKIAIRIIAVPMIYDTQRGFKVFTARAADIIFPKQEMYRFGFDIELLLIARLHGLKVRELPITWDNPPGSTVSLRSYVETFAELAHIFLNKARGHYDPEYAALSAGKGRPTRYLREVLYIPWKIWQEITASRAHLDIQRIQGGRGLIFRGKEYVHHTSLHHSETALYNFVRGQKLFALALLIIIGAALIADWHATLVFIISTITVVYFLDLLFNVYLIYRSVNRNPEIKVSKEDIATLTDAELPRYTIFCPLYKEWQVVPQFVSAMNKLDYPKDKLEIVFLLEENDKETVEKISSEDLPPEFKIIVVPHSMPKTKPKAMNYGLEYVTGEYLVIYDAEDMPEPDQLKKAVLAFRSVPEKVVCIQAKLNFYNVEQNLLTRLFTTEYSLWFDLILPGLQSLDAPIPLGGTSNHFKVAALRELRGWDAFNVTEDCDLGVRLAKRGMRTAIVESTTYEEANSDYKNWYNQRSRWIKGYIQTYFVHMRNLERFKGRMKDLFAFQIIVGGKIFSMFVNPIFWAITLTYFLFRAEAGEFIESFFPQPILYIGVIAFVFGNFLYLYNYMIGCMKRKTDFLAKYVFLIPLYWLGMSLAAWKAVYEIFVKPHYWSKTVHGLHLSKPAPQIVPVDKS